MTERPILFSGPMVRAIIDGKKTMTRRVKKPGRDRCPYGEPGDRLWVKETFATCNHGDIYYRASMPLDLNCGGDAIKWIPSLFMPRRCSRIMLEITGLRIERLQEITGWDAIREGMRSYPGLTYSHLNKTEPIKEFRLLWNNLNEKRGYGWETNPDVWVIEFEVKK